MIALGAGPVVGLDIGNSAVRAAQVAMGRGAPALVSFAQVALPQDAVVDGEIRDGSAVAEAVAQLWKRARLRSKKVVLGVANQRVVVRTVDLPFLEEKDFRSSLRFQVADHIPMSAEDAELDFQIIGDYVTDTGDHVMRVLLVAASSDMVEGFVAAASAAGLQTVGVDLTPFAVARAVSAAARGEQGLAGAEAIVDVGAGVTNIIVHQNGEPRFVRILLVGGDDATTALAEELSISRDQAEALKFDVASGVAPPEAQRILTGKVEALVDEIRGSIDYYLTQDDSQPVGSLILTGGGSLTPGLATRLQQTLHMDIAPAAPLEGMDVSRSGLTPEQVAQVGSVAAAAVGLSMGAQAG